MSVIPFPLQDRSHLERVEGCCMCLVPQTLGIEKMLAMYPEQIRNRKQDLVAARNILNRILEEI